MSDADIQLDDMLEPIERLLEREYHFDGALIQTPKDQSKAQLIYVEHAHHAIHAVRIEESYSDCIFDLDKGIHLAQDLTANKRWIALPLDEFRDGEEEYDEVMTHQCKSRGVGIMTIQKKGRGLSAKVILPPEQNEGRFIEHYPKLDDRWDNQSLEDPDAADGWRVVNLYG